MGIRGIGDVQKGDTLLLWGVPILAKFEKSNQATPLPKEIIKKVLPKAKASASAIEFSSSRRTCGLMQDKNNPKNKE